MQLTPFPNQTFRIWLDFGEYGDFAPGSYSGLEYTQADTRRYREEGYQGKPVEKAIVIMQTQNKIWEC